MYLYMPASSKKYEMLTFPSFFRTLISMYLFVHNKERRNDQNLNLVSV